MLAISERDFLLGHSSKCLLHMRSYVGPLIITGLFSDSLVSLYKPMAPYIISGLYPYTNKKTLNRRDLILGVIANYQKKKKTIKWWWFFSFLFRYINCKVGNLCIINKVYKDDSSFQYIHTRLCKCMYIYGFRISLYSSINM